MLVYDSDDQAGFGPSGVGLCRAFLGWFMSPVRILASYTSPKAVEPNPKLALSLSHCEALWLHGGSGNGGDLDDLWKYDVQAPGQGKPGTPEPFNAKLLNPKPLKSNLLNQTSQI